MTFHTFKITHYLNFLELWNYVNLARAFVLQDFYLEIQISTLPALFGPL